MSKLDDLQRQIDELRTGGVYVMARSDRAGVFAGYLADGETVESTTIGEHHDLVLFNARRIWYWEGAASLSELATRGTSNPARCKFPAAVSKVKLAHVIELLPITHEAAASIAGVPVWTK